MNNPDSTQKALDEMFRIWQKEDLSEIKQVKEDILFFRNLYSKEIFEKEMVESSILTLEIINNLKNLLKNRLVEYDRKYAKTT